MPNTEPVVTSAPGLGTSSGVEIFRTGTYKGTRFTLQDLNAIVQSFSAMRELGWDVPVVLDHEDGDDAPDAPDFSAVGLTGRSSVGWARNFRVDGERLLCDFVDIHPKVVELINNRSYKRVSISLVDRWQDPNSGTAFVWMPSHVALLGALWPEVKGMQDVPLATAQHTAFAAEGLKLQTFTTAGGLNMPEPKTNTKTGNVRMEDAPPEEAAAPSIEELQALVEDLKGQIVEQAQKISELEAALGGGQEDQAGPEDAPATMAQMAATIQKKDATITDLTKRLTVVEANLHKGGIMNMLSSAVQAGKMTPAMSEDKNLHSLLESLEQDQLQHFAQWTEKLPKIINMAEGIPGKRSADDEPVPFTGASKQSVQDLREIETLTKEKGLDPNNIEHLRKCARLFYAKKK